MNDIEFKKQMTRLIEEFDPQRKFYGPERVNAIWEVFKGNTVEHFTRVVSKTFVSERVAPMARDLMRVEGDLRTEDYEERKRNLNKLPDYTGPGRIPEPEEIGQILKGTFRKENV